MFPFTAVIFGGGVILLDYINKIAPYPLIGFVSHFTTECNWGPIWSAIGVQFGVHRNECKFTYDFIRMYR